MNLKYKTWSIFAIGVAVFGFIIFMLTNNIFPGIGPFILLICSPLASAVTTWIYYKSQLRKLKLSDTQFNQAIKSLIQEKKEMSISDIFGLFSSGNKIEKDVEFRKRLNKKIFSWVSKYDFSIQGDKIILTPDNITAFMDGLDKSFDNWYRKNKPKKF
ncbi:MAG: hypothetical protein ACTSO6_04815 [Promethearchaeota archaeon]